VCSVLRLRKGRAEEAGRKFQARTNPFLATGTRDASDVPCPAARPAGRRMPQSAESTVRCSSLRLDLRTVRSPHLRPPPSSEHSCCLNPAGLRANALLCCVVDAPPRTQAGRELSPKGGQGKQPLASFSFSKNPLLNPAGFCSSSLTCCTTAAAALPCQKAAAPHQCMGPLAALPRAGGREGKGICRSGHGGSRRAQLPCHPWPGRRDHCSSCGTRRRGSKQAPTPHHTIAHSARLLSPPFPPHAPVSWLAFLPLPGNLPAR
jgi:hypothetical protein